MGYFSRLGKRSWSASSATEMSSKWTDMLSRYPRSAANPTRSSWGAKMEEIARKGKGRCLRLLWSAFGDLYSLRVATGKASLCIP